MKKKLSPFKNLIKLSNEIAKKIKTGTLLVIETTLPPGTTDKIILPIFKKQLKKRKIKLTDIYICYSYERKSCQAIIILTQQFLIIDVIQV